MIKTKRDKKIRYQPADEHRLKASAHRRFFQSFVVGLALFAGPSVSSMAQSERGSSTSDDPVVHWPRLDFVIPFNVEVTGQTPREIQLEFSENGGRSWMLYSSGDVRTKQFHFKAKVDGEYQFRLKTLDSQGRSFDNPGEPLRVAVDTTKPDAKLVVDIDQRGVMQAEFEISDAAIDVSSIQLAYQTEGLSQWREIPVELSPGQNPLEWFGSGSWSIPSGTRQLVVRLTAKDKAGNPVEVTKLPQLPRSASASGNMQFASGKTRDIGDSNRTIANAPAASTPTMAPPAGNAPIGSGVADSFPKVEVLGAARSSPKLDQLAAAQLQLIEQQSKFIAFQSANPQSFDTTRTPLQVGATENQPFPTIPNAKTDRSVSFENRPLPKNDERPSKLPVRTLTEEEFEQLKTPGPMSLAGKRTEQSLVTPSVPVEIEPKVVRIPGQTSFRKDIKPLYSNSKAFSLDYNIENDADSPVSNVELWGTSDEGQTWQMWGQDPDRASPFDIEVESEGLFGFRMVIVGTNGLASNRPRNGDNADAWIHVDIQQPQARMVSALYGKGKELGSLIIEYVANDDYFPDRPITLSYSQTPNGPWSILASGIRNNGRYVWPADPSLPTSIYLKMEAHDAAGNVGIHQLDLPIDVMGLAPRGRIQGFRPIK